MIIGWNIKIKVAIGLFALNQIIREKTSRHQIECQFNQYLILTCQFMMMNDCQIKMNFIIHL